MRRSPTVVDVAKLAGVGPSTVSRFLRGVNISKKTAVRVEQAIRETAYQPDEAARALRVGRSQTLGVIIPKISNAFFGQSVQLMEERARELGYSVLLFTHMDSAAEQARQLQMLRRYRVDGVLIAAAPGTCAEDVHQCLGDKPTVAFDARFSDQIDTVVLQNRHAARTAAGHLFAHGFKRIAIVGAKPEVFSFSERIVGYSEFMQQRGLTPQLIVGGDYDQMRHMLRSALKATRKPQALLSLSDFATLNVVRVYDELGLAAEKWVPLIGFDDFSYAPLVSVPITVIRQPIEEMVRTALNLLIHHIQNQPSTGAPQVIEIPGELIRRRSCGCA